MGGPPGGPYTPDRPKITQSGTRLLVLPLGVAADSADATVFRECKVEVAGYDLLIAAGGPPCDWIRSQGLRPDAQFDYQAPPLPRARRVQPVDNLNAPGTLMWPVHTCAKCHFGRRPPVPGQADLYANEPYRYANANGDGGHPEGFCHAVKAEIWLSPFREVRRLLVMKDNGTRPRDLDNAALGLPAPYQSQAPPGLRP